VDSNVENPPETALDRGVSMPKAKGRVLLNNSPVPRLKMAFFTA
jgi:hypothetical protein